MLLKSHADVDIESELPDASGPHNKSEFRIVSVILNITLRNRERDFKSIDIEVMSVISKSEFKDI